MRGMRIRFPAISGGPVLAFSNITSGPSTGNTDTSNGATDGWDGCYVGVVGWNLGSSQGDSTIIINDQVCRVLYWGPANSPYWTAGLVNGYHNMQCIFAQVMHNATVGLGTISVVVNGIESNTLPFRVRDGRIFYVKTSGNNNNAGTWISPWATADQVNNEPVIAGDVIYLCNGTDRTSYIYLGPQGTPVSPIALLVYPGHSSHWSTSSNVSMIEPFPSSQVPNQSYINYPEYWTISGLIMDAYSNFMSMSRGWRIVGCEWTGGQHYISDTGYLNVAQGAINNIQQDLRDFAFLGNNLHDLVNGSPATLSHGLYISAGRQIPLPQPDPCPETLPWEVAFNRFYNININSTIRTYNYETAGNWTIQVCNGAVHHNVGIDTCGGFLAGLGSSSKNYYWMNISIRGGKDTTPSNNTDFRNAVTMICTTRNDPSSNVIHCYHNTIFNGGDPASYSQGYNQSGAWQYGDPYYNPPGYLVIPDTHNNLTYQNNGAPYISPNSNCLPTNSGQSSHNLWNGAGSVPAWESSGRGGDPAFVNPTGTFPDLHIQATSDAVGNATSVTLPAGYDLIDFDGHLIVGTRDIGAYQYR